MTRTIHDVGPEVQNLARAAFPEYRGHTVSMRVADSLGTEAGNIAPVTLDCNYWDGGSRNYYKFIALDSHKVLPMPTAHPYFEREQAAQQAGAYLTPGVALVAHSIFCGTDLGLVVTLHPANAAKLLPAVLDMSPDELTVLKATAELKNTYGGRKDIRYSHAHEETGISKKQWLAAQAALVERGMLRKGSLSITPKGRDAAPRRWPIIAQIQEADKA